MQHRYRRLGALAIALFCVSQVGCGSGNPNTAEVTGTVTQKGAPVENVVVTFTPKNGRPATGITDAQGKFTLMTFEEGDGAIPGDHTVTVAPNATGLVPMPGTPEAKKFKSPKTIPPKYSDPMKSGISKTVKDGEPNDFAIEIE